MKLKLKKAVGNLKVGDIIDWSRITSFNLETSDGNSFYITPSEYDVVEDQSKNTVVTGGLPALFGQQLSTLSVEFK